MVFSLDNQGHDSLEQSDNVLFKVRLRYLSVVSYLLIIRLAPIELLTKLRDSTAWPQVF